MKKDTQINAWKLKATKLSKGIVDKYLLLGDVLVKLNAEMGAGDYVRFVDSIGLAHRKEMYLRRISEMRQKIKIPVNVFYGVGWTKTDRLLRAGVLGSGTKEDLKWISLAKTLSVTELNYRLTGKVSRLHPHLIHLTPRQNVLFTRVMLSYGATISKTGNGISGKNEALVKLLKTQAAKGLANP
jgi:hypothetical protein